MRSDTPVQVKDNVSGLWTKERHSLTLEFYACERYHNVFTYHCFQAKDNLHVFDGRHKSGQKSVCIVQKGQDFLKVLFVSVLHNRIDLGRDNTQPPRILEAQRLRTQVWPIWGVHICSKKKLKSHLPISLHVEFYQKLTPNVVYYLIVIHLDLQCKY